MRVVKYALKMKKLPTADASSEIAEFKAIIEHAKEESHLFDFKQKLGSMDDLAEDAMAFANASGGVLYVGVTKNGIVVGATIPNINSTIDQVADKLEPPLRITILPFSAEFDGKTYDLFAIRIPKSKYVHCTKSGRYKIRVENGNRPLLPGEIVRLANERELFHWDSSASSNIDVGDLSVAEISRLKRSAAANRQANLDRMDDEEILSRLRFVVDGEVTRTGVLFLSKTPQRFIPQAVINYLRYEAHTITPVQREIVDGTLGEQIERVELLINAHNKLHQVRVGAKYMDVYDIPPRVIHEAVTNAVAHRDYGVADQITIRHRPNQLSVSSPGTWPPGVNEQNFLRHSSARNPTIAEALRLSGYVERAGIGMPLMFQEMIRYGKRPPEVIADQLHVDIILYSQVAAERMIRLLAELEAKDIVLQMHHILILWHLHASRTIDIKQTAHLVQRKDTAAKNYLKELVSFQLIDRSGYKYRLADAAFRLEGREGEFTRERGLTFGRQKSMVLEHLDRFPSVSNKAVRELLEVDMASATEILQKMVADGHIISTGAGRKYRTYVKASR